MLKNDDNEFLIFIRLKVTNCFEINNTALGKIET